MPQNGDSPPPWPIGAPNSTSAVDWAVAFVAANPDAAALLPGLSVWFLHALRSGYRAGRAHEAFPDA